LSTINFNFFRFSWKFIFIGQFLFCYHSSIMLLSSCLLFYMCCFLIRLFAVWRYAGRIFNAGICRGKAISEFRSPKACTPTLLGTEGVLRCCVCCVVDFCLYAAVLRMERWADLVSVFFGTYSGTLGRSDPCILRYLWWYAGPIWPCILRYLW